MVVRLKPVGTPAEVYACSLVDGLHTEGEGAPIDAGDAELLRAACVGFWASPWGAKSSTFYVSGTEACTVCVDLPILAGEAAYLATCTDEECPVLLHGEDNQVAILQFDEACSDIVIALNNI
jgi:hypothetical protein